MYLVLVADSAVELRNRIGDSLTKAGFDVVGASQSSDLLRLVFSTHPDIIVLAFGLPGMDTVQLVRVLSAATDAAIVLVGNSVLESTSTQVLDAGADAIVSLPLKLGELVSRARAALRRSLRQRELHEEGPVVRTGDLVVDCESHIVMKAGRNVHLTKTEQRLLEVMARRAGQVATHTFLLQKVWGEQYIGDTQYLRTYVGYLRRKLEEAARQPKYLQSEWGLGYRLALLPVGIGTGTRNKPTEAGL